VLSYHLIVGNLEHDGIQKYLSHGILDLPSCYVLHSSISTNKGSNPSMVALCMQWKFLYGHTRHCLWNMNLLLWLLVRFQELHQSLFPLLLASCSIHLVMLSLLLCRQ
jgi:hypothetical protein